MPIPPQIAQMAGGAPGGQAMSPGAGAPNAAPMSMPTKDDGKAMISRIQVGLAAKVLERALTGFGIDSEDGKAVLKALSALSKFGGDSDEPFIPAEIQQLISSLPQMGGGSPTQQAMAAPPGGAAGAPPPQPGLM